MLAVPEFWGNVCLGVVQGHRTMVGHGAAVHLVVPARAWSMVHLEVQCAQMTRGLAPIVLPGRVKKLTPMPG